MGVCVCVSVDVGVDGWGDGCEGGGGGGGTAGLLFQVRDKRWKRLMWLVVSVLLWAPEMPSSPGTHQEWDLG